ncbi:MAG: response regulator [Roseiflexaceae bacterium]|jgi:CheY-like chemotaxis protein
MARIVCFTDNTAVARIVQHSLTDRQHTLHFLAASRLTDDLRQHVRRLAPDVILLDLSQTIDNPHLYFFLRSDEATRHIPVIMLSSGARLAQQATMLGADGYLQRPFLADQLSSMVATHLAPSSACVAA